MQQRCRLLTYLLLAEGIRMTNLICSGLLVVVDFFPMTTSSHVIDCPAVVTFFLPSSPTFSFGRRCDGYLNALVSRRSSLTCVAAIFLVRPAAIPVSVSSLLRMRVAFQYTYVGESFKSGA